MISAAFSYKQHVINYVVRDNRVSLLIHFPCILIDALSFVRSRGSSVGIVTDYRLDDRWFGVPISVLSKMFTPPYRPDRPWGPPNLLPSEYRGQDGAADKSHAPSAKVKKMWI
jgi:hypothetical protein